MARSQVFVSYSHKDAKWLGELKKFLTPLVRDQPIEIWEDTKLRAGDKWLPGIEGALSSAKVAVLLVSANYLASDFIASREMPPIFEAQTREGLRIIWIPISASAYAVTPIKNFQAASDPARPLDTFTAAKRNQLWVEICDAIVEAMELPGAAAETPVEDDGPVEDRVVLLYKRGAQPDEQLLHALETELGRRGVPVWIDRHLRVGMDWARAISDRLERAVAVIPLLSAQSVHSEMLSYEVQVAHQARQRNGGRPKILPVRVQFDDALASPLDILSPLQHAVWTGGQDTPRVIAELNAALAAESHEIPRYVPPVGGALPLDDEFYIARQADTDLAAAIRRKENIILLKGARQMGKTSLLIRGSKEARTAGARTVYIDYQKLNLTQLVSLDVFYRSLCEWLAEELELEVSVESFWNTRRTANMNFERFLERELLPRVGGHFVLAMDETDRLFDFPFKDEFFGLLRSWYNERQMNPDSAWRRMTILIAYATEPHLFISNLSQSPFNVGLALDLADFTPEQTGRMNQLYGSPLTALSKVTSFHNLVGGQPYLVRRGLFEIRTKNYSIEQFEELAVKDDGPFGDHLRRMLVVLARNPPLCEAMREHLRTRRTVATADFYRLRRAGILVGGSPLEARPRCRLYAEYLQRHLDAVQSAATVAG